MTEAQKLKASKYLIITAIMVILITWAFVCFKFWHGFRKQRDAINQSIAAMTPIEKERVAYDLMAAMYNASQSNWTMTVTITPRTNR